MPDKIIISIDGVHREPSAAELEYLLEARAQIQHDIDALEQVEKRKAAARASGRAKLAALGLTDDEINALLGA